MNLFACPSVPPEKWARAALMAGGLAIALWSPVALLAQEYTILHVFGATGDGSVPFGPPTLGGSRHVLGSTASGGGTGCEGYGCGTVFALTQESGGVWHETILHAFADDGDGAGPDGNLVLDEDHLYGTDSGTGPGQAAVFELSHTLGESELSPIYQPYVSPGLLLDSVGDLYGFFGQGNLGDGAIAELSPGPTDGPILSSTVFVALWAAARTAWNPKLR